MPARYKGGSPRGIFIFTHMSKMRKIALIGIGAAAVLTVLAVIFGYPPAVAGVHSLPFFMLLIIDSSRRKPKDPGAEGSEEKPSNENTK